MTTGDSNEVASDQIVSNGSNALEHNGLDSGNGELDGKTEPLSPKKRARTNSQDVEGTGSLSKRVKGVAPIKAESALPTNI